MRAGFAFWLLVGLCLSSWGCRPYDNVCGEQVEEVRTPEGEVARCVRSEDCPRTGTVQVCIDDGLPSETCVRCEDSRCMRHVPEPCP